MKFEEAVEFFKMQETIEDITVLFSKERADQAESLRKIVSAWKKIRLQRSQTKKTCPESDHERWQWLWGEIEYDVEEIKRVTGITMPIEPLIKILIGNRIIYPDATVSEWATKAIKQLLKSQLGL